MQTMGRRTFDAMLAIVSRVQAPSALYLLDAQPSGGAKRSQRACPIAIGTGLSREGEDRAFGGGLVEMMRVRMMKRQSKQQFVMGNFVCGRFDDSASLR